MKAFGMIAYGALLSAPRMHGPSIDRTVRGEEGYLNVLTVHHFFWTAWAALCPYGGEKTDIERMVRKIAGLLPGRIRTRLVNASRRVFERMKGGD